MEELASVLRVVQGQRQPELSRAQRKANIKKLIGRMYGLYLGKLVRHEAHDERGGGGGGGGGGDGGVKAGEEAPTARKLHFSTEEARAMRVIVKVTANLNLIQDLSPRAVKARARKMTTST